MKIALLSALLLLAATGVMVVEALSRLSEPVPVSGMTMMLVAGVGVLVNAGTAALFHAGSRGDLNLRGAYLGMKATRREEGYGDLVGLAWAQRQHPRQYARLHAWLVTERLRDLLPGSHHDTLAWVRLAQDGGTLDGPSIFAAAARLWTDGLAVDD